MRTRTARGEDVASAEVSRERERGKRDRGERGWREGEKRKSEMRGRRENEDTWIERKERVRRSVV